MRGPNVKPTVSLIGKDGNAFSILGATQKALLKEGADGEYISKFKDEAMKGDYDHLLRTVMHYVDIS